LVGLLNLIARIADRTTSATIALRAGIRGLANGEDVDVIIGRLQASTHRGDALPDGRPRLCYAAALRCLEQAGGLRREAAEWLRAARDEVRRGVRR
jgi:hypothetical protein